MELLNERRKGLENTIHILEFDKIVNYLKNICLSTETGDLLEKQKDDIFKKKCRNILMISAEYKKIIASGNKPPNVVLPEVIPVLSKLKKKGVILSVGDIYSILTFVRSSKKIINYLYKNCGDGLIHDFLDGISAIDFPDVYYGYFTSSGEINIKNIPELLEIKNSIYRTNKKRNTVSLNYLRKNTQIWQSSLPVEKDNRILLPLKSDCRGSLKGIVYDVSSSGSTLFIEPFDLLEINNKIAVLKREYEKELLKFLTKMSDSMRGVVDDLEKYFNNIFFLDSIYTRAVYSIRHNCTMTEPLKKGINLREARHPLLGGNAVPIDLVIDSSTHAVIISGPNTGGKTLTLKTAGILSLMNQFGMEIPAEEGSGMAFFDGIHVNIGDEQSIEDSLSTFSARMKNISEITEISTGDSLVLLDEMGSGTGVEEGSAIAMSVFDYLIQKKCLVIATTHHSILKNYGFSVKGVQNASVEFDKDLLKPTYKVIQGIPGESHGIEIAARSGIDEEIINNARKYIKTGKTDTALLADNINKKQQEIRKIKKDLEREQERILRDRDILLKKEKELKEKEVIVRTGEIREIGEFLKSARSKFENLVCKLIEGGLTRDKIAKTKSFFNEISDFGVKQKKHLLDIDKDKPQSPNPVVPGSDVLILSSKQKGRVIRKTKKSRWLISSGALKIELEEKDFTTIVSEKHDNKKEHKFVSVEILNKSRPLFELDVRGMRTEEALSALEKQIDRALLENLGEFSIIHGHGDGILQKNIHKYLKTSENINEFFFSKPGEGGTGKTVIRL